MLSEVSERRQVAEMAERLGVPGAVHRAFDQHRRDEINRVRNRNRAHRITRFPPVTTERRHQPLVLDVEWSAEKR